MAFRMIFLNPFGYIVKNGRLSGSRRGDDQGALSFADGTKKIQDPSSHPTVLGLEAKLLLWLDGGQLIETVLLLPFLQRHSVDGVDVSDLGIRSALVGVGIGLDDRPLPQFEPAN